MTQKDTEKKPIIIEGVCTANHGRSPVFQLIGENYLVRTGFDDEYQAASSGTLVNAIAKGKVPFEKKVQIVKMAMGRDLFHKSDYGFIMNAIESKNKEDQKALDVFYTQAVTAFQTEEHEWRSQALKDFNIHGTIKQTQDQTIARPDTLAVLAMDPGNRDRVKKIYEGTEYNPVIDVLSQYATGNPEAQLPDAFGVSREAYYEVIDNLTKEVPMAIDKLLR